MKWVADFVLGLLSAFLAFGAANVMRQYHRLDQLSYDDDQRESEDWPQPD